MKNGDKIMNIFDIAKETGFSIATVSRAINNSGYVSEKTRAKIMKVIEENNYSVNAFARGMATSTMSQVGILSTDSRDVYQAEAIYHLQHALKEKGFASLLICSGTELRDKQEALGMLLSRNVDSVILIGSQFIEARYKDNQYIKDAAARVPVILINGGIKGKNIYTITCDNEAGMTDALSHVISSGSSNPLMLIRRKTLATVNKIRGFEKGCSDAGIDPEGRVLQTGSDDGIYPQLSSLLDGKSFDALICADDGLAACALRYCDQKKLQVPEDVQVTGFNNSSLTMIASKEITSFDNRTEYLCSAAVSIMNQILDHQEVPSETVFTGQLIERESTRPLPEKPALSREEAEEEDPDERLY